MCKYVNLTKFCVNIKIIQKKTKKQKNHKKL